MLLAKVHVIDLKGGGGSDYTDYFIEWSWDIEKVFIIILSSAVSFHTKLKDATVTSDLDSVSLQAL